MSTRIIEKCNGEVRFCVSQGTDGCLVSSPAAVKGTATRERGGRPLWVALRPRCVVKQSHPAGHLGGGSRLISRPAWPGLCSDF